MKILILGMGKSGKALQKVCEKINRSTLCYDDVGGYASKEEILEAMRSFKKDLFVALSPGIAPSHPLVLEAIRNKCQIGTEIDCAFEWFEKEVGKKIPPFIGVTGTNGKTTVVEFTSFALSEGGFTSETVGNIGLPLIERLFLDPRPLPDFFVIELSSFQLEYTNRCPLVAAAYLNFAPDHLEWHQTLDAYHKSKWKIASLLKSEAYLVLHTSVEKSSNVPSLSFSTSLKTDLGTDGQAVYCKGKRVGVLPQKLQGKLFHDTENFLASWGMLSQVGLPYQKVSGAWELFQKGPHRIQLVKTIDSISFWDDSKATNISSTEAAVRVIDGPIVLIAGGVHKGFSYSSWKDVFKGKVLSIIAIGQAKEALLQDLSPEYPVIFAHSFQEAFDKAYQTIPNSGGHVLLSPGCSSFDMFRDYKDRGDQFQALVKKFEESRYVKA